MGSAVSAVGSIAGGVGGFLGNAVGGVTQGISNGVLPGASMADYGNGNAAYQQMMNQNGQFMNNYGTANGSVTGAGGTSQDALALLRAQADGTAPSPAQAQLQAGTDQAIKTQSAMANSGNQSQMISGQKEAMDNAASLTQQSANQSAQLRAEQMAQGQAAYANAANQAYGTAANYATAQGGLANAAGMGAGGIATAQSGQQQGADNQSQAQHAQMNASILAGMGGMGVSGLLNGAGGGGEDGEAVGAASAAPLPGLGGDAAAGGGASILPMFGMSDEKSKKDIKKDGSMIHAFLEKLDPVTFKYKEATGDMGKTPGMHMGIIAQDVEKAPGGKSMVVETPKGKAIDLASAVGMLMSAAADSHDRMSSLEELFKSKKKGK